MGTILLELILLMTTLRSFDCFTRLMINAFRSSFSFL